MNAARHAEIMMRLAAEKLSRETIRKSSNGIECPVAAKVLARLWALESK